MSKYKVSLRGSENLANLAKWFYIKINRIYVRLATVNKRLKGNNLLPYTKYGNISHLLEVFLNTNRVLDENKDNGKLIASL